MLSTIETVSVLLRTSLSSEPKCFQLYRSFCSRSRLILRLLSPRLFRIDEIRSRYATSSEPLNRKSQSLDTIRCDLVTAPGQAYLRHSQSKRFPHVHSL